MIELAQLADEIGMEIDLDVGSSLFPRLTHDFHGAAGLD
jgi:hypothetical protein